MRKKAVWAVLLVFAAMLLGGCGAAPKDAPADETQPTENPASAPRGALGERAAALMAPYEEELKLVEEKYPYCLTYRVPGDVLAQMASDAQAAGAEPAEGRWRFTWRQRGDYSYQSTAEEAMELAGEDAGATPDPADEAPMDSQLNGDYEVSGGGLFERARTYDAAEDLSAGEAEFTDTLNGHETGREVFRFCVRDGKLYFADAVLDLVSGLDGLAIRDGYLVTVGVLRADGLEIVEYHLDDLSDLPDPAALDWQRFVSSVTPLSRLSAQKDSVGLTER